MAVIARARWKQSFNGKLLGAREVTLTEVDERPVLAKLRDATARLFSPYL